MKNLKRYIPLFITVGVFVCLFVVFNMTNTPPKQISQLSPEQSSYFEEFGTPEIYSEKYISRNGGLLNSRINIQPGVSEPKVTANPVKSDVFAVASNDFSAQNSAGIYITEDGGVNWDLVQVPLSIIKVKNTFYSDPWVEYDNSGNLAFAAVVIRTDNDHRSVVFNVSRDNGKTWLDLPIILKSKESDSEGFDKPKVHFDNSKNVYVTWLEEGDGTEDVYMSISHDGGKTFGGANVIAKGEIQYDDVLFDNDKVYLVYAEEHEEIKLISSNDKGITWSDPVTIAEYEHYEKVEGGQFVIKHNGEKGVRVNSDPQALISDGKLFITFAGQAENKDLSQIYFISGDLQTMQFSEPRALDGNSAGDKFMPALCKDNNGTIYVLYYSSQNDPGNLMTEAYLASTKDLGNSFSFTNLSTESFDPLDIVVDGSYMGDYISLAVNRDRLVAVWTDGRQGSLDLMAGVIPVSN